MLSGTRERTGHKIQWGEVPDGSIAPVCPVSSPPGLARSRKQPHIHGLEPEARLPCGWFKYLGRDPKAKRARESTARTTLAHQTPGV